MSFGFIAGGKGAVAKGGSGASFPDWVYHNFDRRMTAETASPVCSVEILALETFSGRMVSGLSPEGSSLKVPLASSGRNPNIDEVGVGTSGADSITFQCMHYRTQHFVRIPSGMSKRVPHNLPLWCLPPLSRVSGRGEEREEIEAQAEVEKEEQVHRQRVERACTALQTQDLRLELFVPAVNATPNVNVTTYFTTTMGSYPLAARPDLSKDLVIHAVMPYHRVDRFNKIVFHMWLSYHAIMGFHIISSVPNIDFYDELPRHVAKHPRIAHYDSTILRAVNQDCASQYNNPYVVEFEKMMLATFVRFEYRVLYGSRFVVNADPDEFVMSPHGPGFNHFKFSPFKDFNTTAYECEPEKAKTMKLGPGLHSKRLNADLVAQYFAATSAADQDDIIGAPVATAATDKSNLVPLSLTNWKWTADDMIGIKKQAKYIRWVVSEIFALTVSPNSTQSNLVNVRGKSLEVVMHKQYVSTENTTTACVADMVNSTQNDVYTFSKCFDYLSVMHPGTNKFASVRSKYMNINQGCVSDTIHYSCVQNNNHPWVKHFLSTSVHCECHKVMGNPYIFLLHFRENGKSGGHKLDHIKCSLNDHEDTLGTEFSKKTTPRLPYKYE